MAVLLQIANISKSFGDEVLFSGVSLQVREGECVGLIAPNGAGKSTLFRIITGQEVPDDGVVAIQKEISIGYLTQDAEDEEELTVVEDLLQSRQDIAILSDKIHNLEEKMGVLNAHDDIEFDNWLHQHSDFIEKYHHLGGDTLQADALRILRGLGLSEEFDNQIVKTLSGGQKRRLALSKLLLARPDLLLLDEPTNHLDLSAVTWLEDFIRDYRGGVLIVSHDRFLLDKVANHIAEIEDAKIRQFDGNYTTYFEKKNAENEMMLKRSDTIERERARLSASIQRLFSFRQFTRMRSLQKQLFKLEQIILPGEVEKTLLKFQINRQTSKDVINVEKLSKSFGDKTLFKDITFTLYKGDKCVLLGPNGCGKTTLLKIIIGMINPDNGEALPGRNIDWYYYDQESANLDERKTVLQEVWGDCYGVSQTDVRSALARFLIYETEVDRPISTLSGGERSRVSLTKMFLSGANLLILDEPTNHLDIEGKEALEEALAEYKGTILMVSHDRFFIDRMANRVLAMKDAGIKEYIGNYSDYVEKSANEITVPEKMKEIVIKQPRMRQGQSKQREIKAWQKKQVEVEDAIAKLETRISDLETLQGDASLYTDPMRAKKVADEYLQVKENLSAIYNQWEAIAETINNLEIELDIENEGK
ncbi:MAG: ABC-F family ATP-binding cassette domain-containing protein [bacterium]